MASWEDGETECKQKLEEKKIQRRIKKAADALPPLPETASALAVELHQRAEAMLKVRLENIEVSVSRLVDQMIDNVVKETLEPHIKKIVSGIVIERIDKVIIPIVQRLEPEIVASDKMVEYIRNQTRNRMDLIIREHFDAWVKNVAPTEAERLANAALEEVQRYYGSAALLAGDPK